MPVDYQPSSSRGKHGANVEARQDTATCAITGGWLLRAGATAPVVRIRNDPHELWQVDLRALSPRTPNRVVRDGPAAGKTGERKRAVPATR